jgi:hypothetical protein
MKKNVINRNKDIDFLLAQRRLNELTSQNAGPLYFYVFLLISTLLIVGALYAKLKYDESLIQNQIKQLQSDLTNPTNLDKLLQANLLKNDIQKLKQIKAMIEEGVVVLEEIGSINSDPLLTAVGLRPTTLTLTFFDYENQTFTISAHSKDFKVFAVYAQALEDSPLFKDVYYENYVYNETEEYYEIIYVCSFEGGY